jgi:hypothetical protein
MSKFRSSAYAAVVAIAFSSPLIVPAAAKQGNASTVNVYQPANVARPMPAPPKTFAVPQTTLSWPEGSPDYHGSNGG